MSVVVISDDRGQRWTLKDFPVLFGRDDAADVRLTNVLASRRHCELMHTPGGALLRDLGSVNGTCVNGIPIDERELSTGDQFTVGTTTFRVCRIGHDQSSDRARRRVMRGFARMFKKLSREHETAESQLAAAAADSRVDHFQPKVDRSSVANRSS